MKIVIKFDTADEAAQAVRRLGITSLSLSEDQAAKVFAPKIVTASHAPPPLPGLLSDEEGDRDIADRVLDAVRRNPGLTANAVSKVVNISRNRVSPALTYLIRAQLVQRVGRGGNGHPYRYAVAEDRAP